MRKIHAHAEHMPEDLQKWVADTVYLLQQIEPKPSDPRLFWARRLLTEELERKRDLVASHSQAHRQPGGDQ